ncbi:adenylate/guanylate cyclase domain-containing protein [Cupriavidus necator]|uniref:adenylate/guanylate cyclase domain-containing protein n=1 Tax=Cupriavidus necator TaxID=106590 RepID=UPI0039C3A5BF
MATRNWKKDRAQERIRGWVNQVGKVEIKEYLRDTNLAGLGNGVAYRIDGVHLYVDILNIDEMLGITDFEGVRAHSRTLRFLDRHYRAVRDILKDVDAIQVDFHNQRLHAVFAKPYGDETGRIHKAVATAQLIIDVLARTGENSDDPLPAAKVRAGIDSGKALAVNNGRRGNREPLFLGEPANLAAKRSGGGADTGIYMTNTARAVVGWSTVKDEDKTALTEAQIEQSEDVADLDVTADDVVEDWEEGLANQPLGSFEFMRHTPPFADLDLETLTPSNSRRQESTSIYADIDGFTAYVSDRIDEDDSAKDVVRALHVLRAELDAVLHADFAGRKIRFIGDCVHGVLIEGTSQTTDDAETAKSAMLCAAAMRSSFEEAISILEEEGIDTGDLGIQIGLEHGPTAITRLGYKGERIRCCISRAVLRSEDEQRRCKSNETAIGPTAYKFAPEAFRTLFGDSRIRADFDYDEATDALAGKTTSQKSTSASAHTATLPSTQPSRLGRSPVSAAAAFTLPAQAAGPTNPNKVPAGFA